MWFYTLPSTLRTSIIYVSDITTADDQMQIKHLSTAWEVEWEDKTHHIKYFINPRKQLFFSLESQVQHSSNTCHLLIWDSRDRKKYFGFTYKPILAKARNCFSKHTCKVKGGKTTFINLIFIKFFYYYF